jgi:hypothetical protein
MALAGFGVDVAPCSAGLGAPNRPPPNTPDDAPVLEVPPNREPGVPPGLLAAVVFVDEAFPGVVLKRFPPVAPLGFPNQFCSVMTVIAKELFDRVASPKSTSTSESTMPPRTCVLCDNARAVLKQPKIGKKYAGSAFSTCSKLRCTPS